MLIESEELKGIVNSIIITSFSLVMSTISGQAVVSRRSGGTVESGLLHTLELSKSPKILSSTDKCDFKKVGKPVEHYHVSRKTDLVIELLGRHSGYGGWLTMENYRGDTYCPLKTSNVRGLVGSGVCLRPHAR